MVLEIGQKWESTRGVQEYCTIITIDEYDWLLGDGDRTVKYRERHSGEIWYTSESNFLKNWTLLTVHTNDTDFSTIDYEMSRNSPNPDKIIELRKQGQKVKEYHKEIAYNRWKVDPNGYLRLVDALTCEV